MKIEKMTKFIVLILLFGSSLSYGMNGFYVSSNPDYLKEIFEQALINGAKEGKIELVKFLLESGINPNVQNRYGQTALMQAALEYYFDMVKLLLDYGALIMIRDNNGKSVFEKILSQHPNDTWSLEIQNTNVLEHIPIGVASIVMQYADIDLSSIYQKIMNFLNFTFQERLKKRSEKIKKILHSTDFGVPTAALQDLIEEYASDNQEVEGSEENYAFELKGGL